MSVLFAEVEDVVVVGYRRVEEVEHCNMIDCRRTFVGQLAVDL